jgi:hypothetical protein
MRAECKEVFVEPYIMHFDKTHVDQLKNHVQYGTYSHVTTKARLDLSGQNIFVCKCIAFVPVLKPNSFVRAWTKDTPEFQGTIFRQGRLVCMIERHYGQLRSYH